MPQIEIEKTQKGMLIQGPGKGWHPILEVDDSDTFINERDSKGKITPTDSVALRFESGFVIYHPKGTMITYLEA